MSRRKLFRRLVFAMSLLGLLGFFTWRVGWEYVFPSRFAVVEPGRIYRGAWQKDWPMRQIVRKYGIKTIVALAHQANDPLAVREQALATELGCRWVHVPIVDTRVPGDPSVSDRLVTAAAAIADPHNQPVYFHCHHGINRASMAQMAYRMMFCGWTLEQAQDEISRSFGLVEVNHGPDYRHMVEFYDERVLPMRQQAKADSPIKR